MWIIKFKTCVTVSISRRSSEIL